MCVFYNLQQSYIIVVIISLTELSFEQQLYIIAVTISLDELSFEHTELNET